MFVRELQHGSSIATYLTGMRGPEYRRDDTPGGTVRWYVYDGLGSVVEEVDPSGNITASRKYDVYGSVRTATGTSTSKHRFVGALGHPSEDETGLIYMGARYMDPMCGRFISEDPAQNGFNWFTYALNNPVSLVDPDGKAPITWSGLQAAINKLGNYGFWLSLIGMGIGIVACVIFYYAVKRAKSSLDVEEAWGTFMSRWSLINDPGCLGTDWGGAISSALTILAAYTSQTSMLETGGVLGINMAVLCIGYDLRIDYYYRQIDSD